MLVRERPDAGLAIRSYHRKHLLLGTVICIVNAVSLLIYLCNIKINCYSLVVSLKLENDWTDLENLVFGIYQTTI